MKQIAILTLATALICACESPTTPASHQPSGLLGITPDPIVRLDLGTLGGLSSAAADVNNSGTIVGSSLTTTGETHAFRWTLVAGMVDLGTLPGDGWSKAIGITDDQEQQAEIAAALMGMPVEPVRTEVKKANRLASRSATRVITGEQGAQRSVVVERRVVRRFGNDKRTGT